MRNGDDREAKGGGGRQSPRALPPLLPPRGGKWRRQSSPLRSPLFLPSLRRSLAKRRSDGAGDGCRCSPCHLHHPSLTSAEPSRLLSGMMRMMMRRAAMAPLALP